MLNTILATMRTEELLEQSQALTPSSRSVRELQSQQEELKRANTELEQQAQTLKASEELLQSQQEELQQTTRSWKKRRGSSPSRTPDREQEPRDRARAHGARGEGRAAGALVAVQVAVPRQHVARAAHAAEQPAHPRAAARREHRPEPDAEAGRVRADDPPPAPTCCTLINDILDLSKIESGTMRSTSASRGAPKSRDDVERTFRPLAPRKGLGLRRRVGDEAPGTLVTDESGSSRCSRTCSPTRSSSPSRAASVCASSWRAEVQYATPELAGAEAVVAFSVTRHRHRHPEG